MDSRKEKLERNCGLDSLYRVSFNNSSDGIFELIRLVGDAEESASGARGIFKKQNIYACAVNSP